MIKFNNQNGFTLVEILATITLLGIILIAFIPFFTQYAKFVKITEDNLTAINLAKEINHYLKEEESTISFPSSNSSDNPILLTIDQINNENILNTYVINGKNYYPKIYLCQSSNTVENLFETRIEIYTDQNETERRFLTHLYTYLESES